MKTIEKVNGIIIEVCGKNNLPETHVILTNDTGDNSRIQFHFNTWDEIKRTIDKMIRIVDSPTNE